MKKTFSILFSTALLLGASHAYAVTNGGNETIQDFGKPGSVDGHLRSVGFDEFRERCLHPEQFDVQRAPQNIRVQCTDFQTEFVSDKPGIIPLANSRRVVSAIVSDKFYVGGSDPVDVPMLQKGGSCLRFHEVQKAMTVERPMTCTDMLSIKGSLEEFCVSSTTAAKGANPKLINVSATGRVIDTCSGVGITTQGRE